MNNMRNLSILVRSSAIIGIIDLKAFYTLRTWAFGWLMRVIFQVLFFTLIGVYVGSPHTTRFLLIGSAAAIAVLEAMTIVLHTAMDRWLGTLPLLVASPGSYFTMLVARHSNVIATGTATASIALLVCSRIIGIDILSPASLLAVPIILLGAISAYLFGVFLSSLVAKKTSGRWVVMNLGYLGLTALCGFVVPLGFWPAPLTALAQVLPFTHALQALRGLLLNGAGASTIAAQVGLEIVVAAVWLVLGKLALSASVAMARRDGSIDLG